MADQPRTPWFAAKQFGYGAGLPIAWRGWVVLGAYLAVLAACTLLIDRYRSTPTIVAGATFVLVLSTIVLIAIGANRTAGGWRWRP